MRVPALVVALAFPLLAAGLAAQPCIKVYTSGNWGETHRGTRFTPTTVAILVPGQPQAETICQLDFYCYTRSAAPVSMPVWIYDRAQSGQPGDVLSSGTMIVGTSAGVYSAALNASVAANADFFIVFDNAVGNLAPPVALGGTLMTHYHSGPPVWSGPYLSAAWIYRLFGTSGTVASSFGTTGQGCAGIYGVPRIGRVGTPVIGTGFQVTLANAALMAPVVHVVGAVPVQILLGSLGAPGCVIEQQPLATVGMNTSSTGAASFLYTIPNDPSLLGGQLLMQWAVVDGTANALGLSFSPGGVATIGDF